MDELDSLYMGRRQHQEVHEKTTSNPRWMYPGIRCYKLGPPARLGVQNITYRATGRGGGTMMKPKGPGCTAIILGAWQSNHLLAQSS